MGTTVPAGRRLNEQPLLTRLARYTGRRPEAGVVVLIVLVGLVFTLLTPHFLTGGNLSTLSLDATVVMLLAIGQSFVLLTGNIDLSTGALAAFGGVLVAIFINDGVPWELAVLLASLVTAAGGVVNGVITHYVRIPSFLTTFGMLGAGETLALVLSHDTSVQVNKPAYAYLGTQSFGGFPLAVIIVLVVMVLCQVMLRRTTFGFDLYALGGNAKGAVLSGVSAAKVTIGAFLLSGLFAGFGGCITTSRLMAGYPSSGTGDLLFDSIAGAVVGGVSLFGGVGTAVGAFLGALLIGTIQDGMNVLALSFSWQPLVIGVVIVAGVAYDVTVRRAHVIRRLMLVLRGENGFQQGSGTTKPTGPTAAGESLPAEGMAHDHGTLQASLGNERDLSVSRGPRAAEHGRHTPREMK
jgi:ribose transport system permease protein